MVSEIETLESKLSFLENAIKKVLFSNFQDTKSEIEISIRNFKISKIISNLKTSTSWNSLALQEETLTYLSDKEKECKIILFELSKLENLIEEKVRQLFKFEKDEEKLLELD